MMTSEMIKLFNSIGAIVFCTEIIFMMTIYPALFRWVVIPRIEKRLNERFLYLAPFYKWQVFASWFYPPIDVGGIITLQFLQWKIKNKAPGKVIGYNPKSFSGLQVMGYDIREASKIEVILSFVVMLHLLLCLFFAGMYFIFFRNTV